MTIFLKIYCFFNKNHINLRLAVNLFSFRSASGTSAAKCHGGMYGKRYNLFYRRNIKEQ